jgi:ABC-type multidrug transport system ATPase subunit
MDEAEMLADKIAVMVTGRLCAVGTAEELKARFAGYRLTISFTDTYETHTFIDSVNMLEWIDRNSNRLNDARWSVEQMPLEDVFVRIMDAEEYRFTDGDDLDSFSH